MGAMQSKRARNPFNCFRRMGRENRVVPISKPVATNTRPTLQNQRPSSPMPVSSHVVEGDLVIEDIENETVEWDYVLPPQVCKAPMVPSLNTRARSYMTDCQNEQIETRQDVLTLNVPTDNDGFPLYYGEVTGDDIEHKNLSAVDDDDDNDTVISDSGTESDVEDNLDDDSLTTVTSLDNMLFDSEPLSILDGEMTMCNAPVITNEKISSDDFVNYNTPAVRYTDSDDDLVSSLSETDIEDDIDDDSLTSVTSLEDLESLSVLDDKMLLSNTEFPQVVDNEKIATEDVVEYNTPAVRYTDSDDDLVSSLSETDIDDDSLTTVDDSNWIDGEMPMFNGEFQQFFTDEKVVMEDVIEYNTPAVRYTDSDDDLVSSLSETDIEEDIDDDSLDNMSFDSELTMCNDEFLQRTDNEKIVTENPHYESDEDFGSVICETGDDDDSLTTVTSLDNMSFDSELLSILDGEMPGERQLSRYNPKLCISTNENEMALNDDLSELKLMFTSCSEEKDSSTAMKVLPEKQPDYVLFMSLPTLDDIQ